MNVKMHEISCATCGIAFCITDLFNDRLLKSHTSFFCPRGHKQHYVGETDAEKLKRTRGYLANANDREQATSRSNSALRGVITKMKAKR